MKYDVKELFAKFNKASSLSDKDRILYQSKIEDYLNWTKPDFVSLITPHEEELFPFQQNIRLDFNGRSETVLEAVKAVDQNQVALIAKVDKLTMDFLFQAKFKPMEVLMDLRFNIELVPGILRTCFRTIQILSVNRNNNPEVGIMGITYTTDSTVIPNIGFEIKTCPSADVDVKLLETFRQQISDVLSPEIDLTDREKEILIKLEKGLTSQEIASCLNIAKSTVDKHRQNMIKKYNLPNITTLIHYVKNKGHVFY